MRKKSSEAFCFSSFLTCIRRRGVEPQPPEAYCFKFPNSANSEKQGGGGRNIGNKTEEEGEHREMKGRSVLKLWSVVRGEHWAKNFLEGRLGDSVR